MPPLHTLVLEDELPARKLLVRLIEETGLAEVVGVAATVAEAVQVLRSRPVDVAFVDIRLPRGESGLDLIQRSTSLGAPAEERRSRSPGRPLFVLATAVERHALRAFELGVVDYLLKPFSEERVEQCLRRISRLVEDEAALRT